MRQSPKKILSNNWFLVSLSFRTAPFFMAFMIFEQVKQQGLEFLEHGYGIQYVLEAAEFQKPFSSVLRFLLVVFAAWAISFLFSGIYQNLVSQKGLPKIEKQLKGMLYDKVKDLDLECYDNPDYYNEFVFSISEAQESINRTHQIIEALFRGITILITSGLFILTIDAAAFYFILASFILTFFISQVINKLSYQIRLERNPLERKRSYVHRVFYLNEYAKEVRLSPDITERLYEEFDASNRQIREIEKKNSRKRSVLWFCNDYLANDFISDVLFISYLVYQASVLHTISYSSVVVLWHMAGRVRNSLRTISRVFPKVSENSLYIEKIRNFLNIEQKITSEENLPLPKEPKLLELRHVSFGYSQDGYILQDINLTIHPEEKVALVGYNGAGKTTLIKLIMRLYDPAEGEIVYDGINIRKYNVREYRERIGTIFQDFKIFATDIRNNVVLDHEEKLLQKLHEPEVRKALHYSGFGDRLEQLPNELSTELTTEFEESGIDLSGGESQKLAIARAFYKDAQLVILDEPSSALDPIAEYQLNEAMLQAAEQKSVVFISHRLSTTRNADRIIMLEQGRIIEEGSHKDLLIRRGKYAEMWKAQASKYVDV